MKRTENWQMSYTLCSNYAVSVCVGDMGVDIQEIKDNAESDLEYQTLLDKVVTDSFAANKRDEDPIVKKYFGFADLSLFF